MDMITSNNDLFYFVLHIPKHNIPIIGEEMNAQIDKDENIKFCLHNSSNRNGEYLANFSLENRIGCLDTKFQKKGELWTDTDQKNSKAHRLYIHKQKVNK